MATARLQKQEDARQLHEDLAEVPHAILVDFQGLNVEGATDLRRKLRDGDARLKVVKNSTALRAIEDLPLAVLADVFVGQTAIAYTSGDVVNLAKTLREFAEEFETPTFKAGIVDGTPISAEEFEQLAQLPPREQLIAKALYLMNYPLTGLVTALSGILRGFVVALEQIRLQKEEAGEAEPAAAVEEAAGADEAEEAAGADEAEKAAGADEAEEAAGADGAEEAASADEAEEAAGAAETEEVAEEVEAATADAVEESAPEEAAAESADEAADAAADEAADEVADEAADEPADKAADGDEK